MAARGRWWRTHPRRGLHPAAARRAGWGLRSAAARRAEAPSDDAPARGRAGAPRGAAAGAPAAPMRRWRRRVGGARRGGPGAPHDRRAGAPRGWWARPRPVAPARLGTTARPTCRRRASRLDSREAVGVGRPRPEPAGEASGLGGRGVRPPLDRRGRANWVPVMAMSAAGRGWGVHLQLRWAGHVIAGDGGADQLREGCPRDTRSGGRVAGICEADAAPLSPPPPMHSSAPRWPLLSLRSLSPRRCVVSLLCCAPALFSGPPGRRGKPCRRCRSSRPVQVGPLRTDSRPTSTSHDARHWCG